MPGTGKCGGLPRAVWGTGSCGGMGHLKGSRRLRSGWSRLSLTRPSELGEGAEETGARKEGKRKVVVKRPYNFTWGQGRGPEPLEEARGGCRLPRLRYGVGGGAHTGCSRAAPSPFLALQHAPFLAWAAEAGLLASCCHRVSFGH